MSANNKRTINYQGRAYRTRYYGTPDETFVTIDGTVYLVQSPDMLPGVKWVELDHLPADAIPISIGLVPEFLDTAEDIVVEALS